MKTTKWVGFQFASRIHPSDDYLSFQRDAKADLKKMANTAGFELDQFNKNHFEFSAVLKHRETGEFIYIRISDVRYFPDQWWNNVLIRTMQHDRDWTGGPNHYCRWSDIGTTAVQLIGGTCSGRYPA